MIFLLGFIIGLICGMFCMALAKVSKDIEITEDDEKELSKHITKNTESDLQDL